MEALNNINILSLRDLLASLSTAFLLDSMIGLERQYRQRTAGLLRTNVLVAVGAAVFVDMANRLTGHEGAVHVAAYVVSGIGFLGAGVIMKGDGGIRGLNTAATLWGGGGSRHLCGCGLASGGHSRRSVCVGRKHIAPARGERDQSQAH
ncbi:MAG: MgtC/SapB family protein [Candidatus Methylumidiphilus sp.]